MATATIASGPAVAQNINNPGKMTKAMTADAVMDHLEAFQAIADANDGNRAAGTSPHWRSHARSRTAPAWPSAT